MDFIVHLLGPLHPPMDHFSVVCPLLAVVALLAYRFTRKPWLEEAAAWLWILTSLSALTSGLTGYLFSLHLGLVSHFNLIPPETVLKGLLRDHVLWAMAATFLSFFSLVAALKTLRKKPWRWGIQLSLGLSVALLFTLTGHHGGEMVYGDDEVTAAAPSKGESDLLDRAQNYRKTLVKMNSKLWNSRTHGHRWVNTYVSKEGADAYRNSNPLPEGSLVVKESFENRGGKALDQPGPLYVMRKGKIADSPETGGWQYALSWEKPVPGNPEQMKGPIKWLPGNPHLNSCVKCHNHFKSTDYLGGIPDGFEAPSF